MKHYEIKVYLQSENDLNTELALIHAALYASGYDPIGVTVQEYDSIPVFDVANYEEEPTEPEGPSLAVDRLAGYPTIRDVIESVSYNDLIHGLKENGDRYRG